MHLPTVDRLRVCYLANRCRAKTFLGHTPKHVSVSISLFAGRQCSSKERCSSILRCVTLCVYKADLNARRRRAARPWEVRSRCGWARANGRRRFSAVVRDKRFFRCLMVLVWTSMHVSRGFPVSNTASGAQAQAIQISSRISQISLTTHIRPKPCITKYSWQA